MKQSQHFLEKRADLPTTCFARGRRNADIASPSRSSRHHDRRDNSDSTDDDDDGRQRGSEHHRDIDERPSPRQGQATGGRRVSVERQRKPYSAPERQGYRGPTGSVPFTVSLLSG